MNESGEPMDAVRQKVHIQTHGDVTSSAEPGAVAAPLAEAVFEVSDLAVYYGPFRAVRDVNLTIRKNEITAFIGPSGCGSRPFCGASIG
jgi:phosphate transport system ATP-binding protein